MSLPANVVPLRRLEAQEDEDATAGPNVLGMLHRKDFELWVCRTPGGALSLKWWRWRGDLERFFPLGEGELTLDASELQPLADLLASVGKRLNG